jgi:superoxide dismutase, Fe-Mn family
MKVLEAPAQTSTLTGVHRAPTGALAQAIERDFGGLANLQTRFAAAVDEHVGAGWVWLATSQDHDGKLHVLASGPHVFPLLHGYDAILERYVAPPARPWLDRHGRAAELNAWWRLVNWTHVARRYEHGRRLHAPN